MNVVQGYEKVLFPEEINNYNITYNPLTHKIFFLVLKTKKIFQLTDSEHLSNSLVFE